jgi:hypothetical protein
VFAGYTGVSFAPTEHPRNLHRDGRRHIARSRDISSQLPSGDVGIRVDPVTSGTSIATRSM